MLKAAAETARGIVAALAEIRADEAGNIAVEQEAPLPPPQKNGSLIEESRTDVLKRPAPRAAPIALGIFHTLSSEVSGETNIV
ncbi:hypothetical protein [Tritonibacter mobilis]|uniref:hypothetical protein n=1 Tax=Tritonibacter mobilis TaxID=379347 RepID=UPI001C0A6422|nr:hypothetical protein [Tritonibacter mobilis]MBU3034253.1 hypothetical protein [Tritonibacter mobilis]WHQ84308.1 hypothetical protein OMR53_19285 [Tritonibacter mobilis]